MERSIELLRNLLAPGSWPNTFFTAVLASLIAYPLWAMLSRWAKGKAKALSAQNIRAAAHRNSAVEQLMASKHDEIITTIWTAAAAILGVVSFLGYIFAPIVASYSVLPVGVYGWFQRIWWLLVTIGLMALAVICLLFVVANGLVLADLNRRRSQQAAISETAPVP